MTAFSFFFAKQKYWEHHRPCWVLVNGRKNRSQLYVDSVCDNTGLRGQAAPGCYFWFLWEPQFIPLGNGMSGRRLLASALFQESRTLPPFPGWLVASRGQSSALPTLTLERWHIDFTTICNCVDFFSPGSQWNKRVQSLLLRPPASHPQTPPNLSPTAGGSKEDEASTADYKLQRFCPRCRRHRLWGLCVWEMGGFVRRQWSNIFKILKERKCEPSRLYPEKMTFNIKVMILSRN